MAQQQQHQKLLQFLQLFTILCSVLFVETASDIENKKAVVRRLAQCSGKRNLPMVFSGYQSKRDEITNQTLSSLKVTVKSTISSDLTISFSFSKCDASGNPDSCEYVLKDHNTTDICTLMLAKNELWTPFVDSFDKLLKCPIEPGVYKSSNLIINTDFLRFLPMGNALWKTQLVGYAENKVICCVTLIMEIVPVYVQRQ